MKANETCILINNEEELGTILKMKDHIFILFYAPWCPFSRQFLAVFEKCSKDTSMQCYRMMVDEYPALCDKYHIEVFPTVLFFEQGKVSKRLDGIHGVGLSEQQFRGLIGACEALSK